MTRGLGVLGAGLGLCACAGPPPPSGPTPFDGTYAGTAQLVGFSSPDWHCFWTPQPITIRDGRFHSNIDGAPMTVTVAPDGTFNKYAARPVYSQTKYETPVHMSGRIAGGLMDATVHQPRCTFHVVMRRR